VRNISGHSVHVVDLYQNRTFYGEPISIRTTQHIIDTENLNTSIIRLYNILLEGIIKYNNGSIITQDRDLALLYLTHSYKVFYSLMIT